MVDNEPIGERIESELKQGGEPIGFTQPAKLLSLADIIKQRGPLPEREVIQIFIQVLDDLDLAHSQAMIHRDISTARVVKDGKVWKLTDYGVASVGTVRYMSPERCQGKPMDGRSDIYSLGIALYEAVTGKVPFDEGLKHEIMQAQVNSPPPPPRTLKKDVSQGLEGIILRALSKNPAGRYRTAMEFRQGLVNLSKGTTTPAATLAPPREERPPEPEPWKPAPEPRPEEEFPGHVEFIEPKKWKSGAVILPLLAVAVIGVGFLFLKDIGTIKMPNLVGRDRDGAVQVLKGMGVAPVIQELDDTLAEGTVKSQFPEAGARIRKSSPVRLGVSTGSVVVPTVSGFNLDEVMAKLSAVGLVPVRVDSQFSDYYSPGMVMASSPKAGSRVRTNSGVALSVSAGRGLCPKCGARREPGARFCDKCGFKMF